MNKYKVTKEFMDELVTWRDKQCIDVTRGYGFVYHDDLAKVPPLVKAWWLFDNTSIERNKRLIAIVSWLNGEDVFEVKKQHKFVLLNAYPDTYGEYTYVEVNGGIAQPVYLLEYATKFNTQEEALEWANSHQVVVDVVE